MRQLDREDYIRRHCAKDLASGKSLASLVEKKTPVWEKPCRIVGASRMKDLPDFRIRAYDYLAARKDQALKELQLELRLRNQPFIDHWLKRTVEEQMAEDGGKYCCDHCPLLDELNGSDSQQSMFLGITVASCDYRGKVIGADSALGDQADEAYTEHDPDQMMDYADRLEQHLPILRQRGLLGKDSYERYVKNLEQDPFAKAFGERTLTRTEYDQTPHWREENILQAVHWLRTCASYDIHMHPDY
jgi:hypothetical protein